MSPINLNKKNFRLLENSANGAVSDATTFSYLQKEEIVTAVYSGGGVLSGQILAKWRTNDQLEMRYHCAMEDQSLKAGKAIAQAIINNDDLIELHLDWQWLGDQPDKGNSIYVEIYES